MASPQDDHGGHMNMTHSEFMSNASMKKNQMIMHMSFYWGKDAIVIFSGWPNQNLGMYVLALFCVFVLALSIEVLSSLSTVKPGTNPILGGLTQASIYALRMGFAYLVMLAVMSFNLGIFIAAVAGHAVGFFLIKTRALALTKSTDQTTSSTGVARKV